MHCTLPPCCSYNNWIVRCRHCIATATFGPHASYKNWTRYALPCLVPYALYAIANYCYLHHKFASTQAKRKTDVHVYAIITIMNPIHL